MKLNSFKNVIQMLMDKNGSQVVFMSGVFDLFHIGHYIALKKAASFADVLVIQIDGNILVKKRKGITRPIIDQRVRAEIISQLEFVDYVFISNTPSESTNKLKKINPDIYVRAIKESESSSKRMIREEKILSALPNTKIMWLKQYPDMSTTKIIKNTDIKDHYQTMSKYV